MVASSAHPHLVSATRSLSRSLPRDADTAWRSSCGTLLRRRSAGRPLRGVSWAGRGRDTRASSQTSSANWGRASRLGGVCRQSGWPPGPPLRTRKDVLARALVGFGRGRLAPGASQLGSDRRMTTASLPAATAVGRLRPAISGLQPSASPPWGWHYLSSSSVASPGRATTTSRMAPRSSFWGDWRGRGSAG